jgi:hypothetical protein
MFGLRIKTIVDIKKYSYRSGGKVVTENKYTIKPDKIEQYPLPVADDDVEDDVDDY